MLESIFQKSDFDQIASINSTPEKVIFQIDLFKKGTPYLKLIRPCTKGDGIRSISGDEIEKLTAIFEKYGQKKKLIKFVPASGAASRMFKTLLKFNNAPETIHKNTLVLAARKGDMDSQAVLTFMNDIKKFAFYNDLKSAMLKDGLDIKTLIGEGQFNKIIAYLLTRLGLDYQLMPKGLIKFHHYNKTDRTAFEEHLVESAAYAKNHQGVCSLHFTVSPEHQPKFEALLNTVRDRYEKTYGITFQVRFSAQEKATDTIAVDPDNKPFRDKEGALLFRPGGHGALIENLNHLDADIVFIKNIDNVAPDRLKNHSVLWNKVLGGYLIKIQQKIFSYLQKMATGSADKALIDDAFKFVENELGISPSPGEKLATDRAKQDFLIKMLNRPTRICGMVKNIGEPGGGPFWVETKDFSHSSQIVESAQVNIKSETQKSILNASTHFNPVHIVCGVRDWREKPFDLEKYVDPSAVFISEKSKDGRDLKALELPGLWNGAMAHWNTIFVEVPIETFSPVKTVNDLLRDEHQ